MIRPQECTSSLSAFKKRRLKKIADVALTGVCIGILATAGYHLGQTWLEAQHRERVWQEAGALYQVGRESAAAKTAAAPNSASAGPPRKQALPEPAAHTSAMSLGSAAMGSGPNGWTPFAVRMSSPAALRAKYTDAGNSTAPYYLADSMPFAVRAAGLAALRSQHLSTDTKPAPDSTSIQAPSPLKASGLTALRAKYPDVVGWLSIPDTRIHYPVVQAADNDYYLHRNLAGEPAREGSIFMDMRNEPAAPLRHTVLYGHRMKDGVMFGDLRKFLDGAFLAAHPTFEFESLAGRYRVEIFSVYPTTTDIDYIQTDFRDDAAYLHFLQSVQAQSLFHTGVQVTAEDAVLTLSTCDYTLAPEEGRLAVHGVLIPIDGK